MIVLDTNVLSEVMKTAPDPRVARWMKAYAQSEITTTAICEAEILWGIALLPQGNRRASLSSVARSVVGIFAGRILAFDSLAASHYAEIMEARRSAGRRVSEMDALIAAITRSRGFTLATRNITDFDDINLALVNPWDAQA